MSRLPAGLTPVLQTAAELQDEAGGFVNVFRGAPQPPAG
jgi:hypothetical protein